jgi:hypothetical protein
MIHIVDLRVSGPPIIIIIIIIPTLLTSSALRGKHDRPGKSGRRLRKSCTLSTCRFDKDSSLADKVRHLQTKIRHLQTKIRHLQTKIRHLQIKIRHWSQRFAATSVTCVSGTRKSPPRGRLPHFLRAPVLSPAAIGARSLYAALSHLVCITRGYRQYDRSPACSAAPRGYTHTIIIMRVITEVVIRPNNSRCSGDSG